LTPGDVVAGVLIQGAATPKEGIFPPADVSSSLGTPQNALSSPIFPEIYKLIYMIILAAGYYYY
jgi:hypothetical protein